MSTDPESLNGQQIHFLGPLTVPVSTSLWSTGASMNYGDTLDVSDEVIEAGFDRRQAHWLSVIDDEFEQVERYGERKFARGPFPAHLPAADPHGPTLAELMNKPYHQHIAATGTNYSDTGTNFLGLTR